MAVQTVQSVPNWAHTAVQNYANVAYDLSKDNAISPTILVSSGTGAFLSPVLTNGVVTSIDIIDGGMMYPVAPDLIILPSNGVSSTPATATCTVTNGVITGTTVTAGGSGFTATPDVILVTHGFGCTAYATISAGHVTALHVINGGLQYTVAPMVTIYGGGGSGATATAVLGASLQADQVVSFTITNGGSGYSGVGTTFAPYTGTVNVAQDSYELAGINNLANRGKSGNLTISGAYDFVDDVIKGSKLSGLPAALTSKILSQETSAFASMLALIGKKSFYVGDPDTTYLARTLNAASLTTYNDRLNSKLENDNYHYERASMDMAMGIGIDYAKQAVIDAEALRQSGLYVRQYLQGTYENLHKQFIEGEEFNVVKLEIFGNALRALTGSQQTTVSGDHTASPLMAAVGIGATMLGIYNAMSSAGIFTAAGTAIAETYVAATASAAAIEEIGVAAMAAALL